MIEQKDVTIIIPHFGSTPEQEYALRECMASLQETVPDIRKILVENGKPGFHNPHANMTGIKNYELITMDAQGQNRAVNAAVATTNTPWVFISNDDMIYAPGWFDRLVYLNYVTRAVPVDDDNVLCISPQLVEPRVGAPTFLTKFCGGAGGDFNKEKWLEYAKRHSYDNQGLRTAFNFPLLIRRDLWDIIGGYDINYDPWGSNGDSDLEYKIMLAGIQPYQNTNCIVYHFSQTSGTFEPKNDSYRFKNYAYFKEKWGFDRTDDGIWQANFKIPTKEEGRIFTPWYEGKFSKEVSLHD